MTFKQKIFSIIASIFIVLVLDQLFFHYLFPKKRAEFIKSANQEVQEALLAHPPADDAPPLSGVSARIVKPGTKTEAPAKEPQLESRPAQSLTDFSTAAKQCLGGNWSGISSLAEDLEKNYGVQNKTKDIENYHLKLPSGEERRIHITYEAADKKQVRYFGVDSENLPVPVALSDEQRKMTPDQLIENLKSSGQIFLHQTKERWLLGNGSTFIVTFENNETREFQLFGATRTLSCLEESCQCL